MSKFDKIVLNFFKNYQDRGMEKWAGFYLSDHTMKINKDKSKRAVVYKEKKMMTEKEISAMLLAAFSNHYLVHIQLKEVDGNDNLHPDIVGFVEGYQEDKIIITRRMVKLDDINNIKIDKK